MRPRRFERLTPTFGGLYSIHLSYERMVHWMRVELTPVSGLAPETSAYTNSATSARIDNNTLFLQKIEDGLPDLLVFLRRFFDVHNEAFVFIELRYPIF